VIIVVQFSNYANTQPFKKPCHISNGLISRQTRESPDRDCGTFRIELPFGDCFDLAVLRPLAHRVKHSRGLLKECDSAVLVRGPGSRPSAERDWTKRNRRTWNREEGKRLAKRLARPSDKLMSHRKLTTLDPRKTRLRNIEALSKLALRKAVD